MNGIKQNQCFETILVFNEYLAEFHKYTNDTGYDIANQKNCLFAGMQLKLNMLLVQHDIDQMIFDEMVKLSVSLISKIQLAHQNKPKNYNSAPLFNKIYVSPSFANTMNNIPP